MASKISVEEKLAVQKLKTIKAFEKLEETKLYFELYIDRLKALGINNDLLKTLLDNITSLTIDNSTNLNYLSLLSPIKKELITENLQYKKIYGNLLTYCISLKNIFTYIYKRVILFCKYHYKHETPLCSQPNLTHFYKTYINNNQSHVGGGKYTRQIRVINKQIRELLELITPDIKDLSLKHTKKGNKFGPLYTGYIETLSARDPSIQSIDKLINILNEHQTTELDVKGKKTSVGRKANVIENLKAVNTLYQKLESLMEQDKKETDKVYNNLVTEMMNNSTVYTEEDLTTHNNTEEDQELAKLMAWGKGETNAGGSRQKSKTHNKKSKTHNKSKASKLNKSKKTRKNRKH